MALQNDKKATVRERYRGVDPSLVEVIPATVPDTLAVEDRILNVAAYVRVSTDKDEQTSSFELQQSHFTERIQSNPKWNFVGIYADEGISGTELSHRKGMLQMLEDCRAGKIDYIMAKSIARFARNVVDCLSIIEELKNMNPPVGVYFEAENFCTLDPTGVLLLTIMATMAEEESRNKSVIMNWSIDRRFSRGIFLTQKLLGYDRDNEGNLFVNPQEAETVKVIYALYINGWTPAEIAKLLTKYGRKTKLGKKVWHSSMIRSVIENERYCGDILARKTYTPNFKNHKAKKNKGNRNKYRQRDHHEPIVSRDVYNAANHMAASRTYTSKNKPLPVLSVIDGGMLKGYVPIDKDWKGFSAKDYKKACESVEQEEITAPPAGKCLNMQGFQIVRSQFFPSAIDLIMNISQTNLRFNTACMRKFVDVEYVELLLNTVKNCIAIRPCAEDNPKAIHWGRLRGGKWVVSSVGAKGLYRTLIDIMSWEDNANYRFNGQFITKGEDKLLLFELDEPVVTRTETQIIVPDESDDAGEKIVMNETIRSYPASWTTSFGTPITYLTCKKQLEQVHDSLESDILRPAKEVEGMNIFTANELEGLMREAETIIEGWKAL